MPDQVPTQLAWIGAGGMGLPMLSRLIAAGYRVVACDSDPERQRLAGSAGARLVASPAEAAGQSDAIFLSLPSGQAVTEVVFGTDGCVAGGLDHKLVIDTTSMDPVLTQDLAGRLAREAGGLWIDAPVSGGVGSAAQGKLVALVGGAPDHVATATPWLSTFAARIVHLGPVGSGQWAKLCNQAVICGTIALWREAFALARNGGISPQDLLAALEGATADSRVRQVFGPEIATGKFAPSANLQKDIATALARSGTADRDMIATTARLFRALERH